MEGCEWKGVNGKGLKKILGAKLYLPRPAQRWPDWRLAADRTQKSAECEW